MTTTENTIQLPITIDGTTRTVTFEVTTTGRMSDAVSEPVFVAGGQAVSIRATHGNDRDMASLGYGVRKGNVAKDESGRKWGYSAVAFVDGRWTRVTF